MASGNRHWSIEGADYKQLINKAIDQVADAMGIVFAVRGAGNNQQLAKVQLEIQAVNSIKKYRKLENYLRELSAVEMAIPLKIDGQNASFELTLRSSEDDFLNLIKNDAELVKAKPIKPQVDVQIQPEDDQSSSDQSGPDQSSLDQPGSEKTGEVVADVATDSNNPLQPQPQPEKQTPQIPVYHYKLIN